MMSQSSSPGSSSASALPKANRACEKCTRAKKKCDKGLPSCSRCTRLVTRCVYDYTLTPPTLNIGGEHHPGGFGPGSNTDLTRFNLLDPASHVTAGQIHTLLACRGIDWRDVVANYFQTMHNWFSIVQTECFDAKLEAHARLMASDVGSHSPPMGASSGGSGAGECRSEELAMLFACMHLCSLWAEDYDPVPMLGMDLYVSVKRAFAVLKACANPSVELAQCGLLLAVYEHGHGDARRAYATFSEAVAVARVVGVAPGSYVPQEGRAVSPEEEQLRVLYWAFFVWDKLSHLDQAIMPLPSLIPAPPPRALLPLDNYLVENLARQLHRVPIRAPVSAPLSTPLGGFQRACQAAVLVARALEWKATCEGGSGGDAGGSSNPDTSVFEELDAEARGMVDMMVVLEVGEECGDSFAMLLTLLIILASTILESCDPALNTPEITLKALSTLNFAIRLVLDSYTSLAHITSTATSASSTPHLGSGIGLRSSSSSSVAAGPGTGAAGLRGHPVMRLCLPATAHAVFEAGGSAEGLGEGDVGILRGVAGCLGRRWGMVKRFRG